MSPYEQNILELHSIYIDHPQLFTPDVRESLAELLSGLSEKDNTKHISISVIRWCKSQPDIWDAFLKLPISNENEMGPNRTKMLSTCKPLHLLYEVISAPLKDAQGSSTSQADSQPAVKTDDGSGNDGTGASARE